jgi:nanoRNase/pAp phosphatase (c-di-AMP/oligoRNAs hydrolase)
MVLSLRTSAPDGRADQVIRKVVGSAGTGGGHTTMAGGQVQMDKETDTARKELARVVRQRYLQVTGNNPNACRKLS